MFCKNCGNQLPDDAKFCVRCGQKVDTCTQGTGPASEQMETQSVRGGDDIYQNSFYPDMGQERMAGNRKKNLIPIVILLPVLAVIIGFAAFILFGKQNVRGTKNETDDGESLTLSISESSIASVETVTPTPVERKVTVSEDIPSGLSDKTELYFCTAVASSALVQENTSIYNGAECAVDGDVITSWQEGAEGNGIGETITIGFQNPQKVSYLEFHAGNWRDKERWERNLRPKGLEITANGEKYEVVFQNNQKIQYVVFSEPIETVAFVIKITDVYPGAEGESDVPISEIRAFGEASGKNERVISDTQPNNNAVTEQQSQNTENHDNQAGAEQAKNTNANAPWYELHPYWIRGDDAYACHVYYTEAGDLIFDYGNGVSLRSKQAAYELLANGSLKYGIGRGWIEVYDPNEGSLWAFCEFPERSLDIIGYYYPATQEEYNNFIGAGSAVSDDVPEEETYETWRRSEETCRTILQKLDHYGSLSFISESGKSAITFDEDKQGSDCTFMWYTNISGVTPDDVWSFLDGSVSGNTATLHLRNAQGQRAKVVADFESETIDFSGIIYRNTATKYH